LAIAITITPDGRRVIFEGWNNSLYDWDLKNGQYLKQLKGHADVVSAVAVTPDGRRAVSASWDNTLRIWDLISGRCLHILKGHTNAIYTITITPDGRHVISGSEDFTIRLWKLESGACLAVYPVRSGAVQTLVTARSGTIAFGSKTGKVAFLRIHKRDLTAPTVTPIRYWLQSANQINSVWDDKLTTVCEWCGHRFSTPDEILEMIEDIQRNANLTPDQSPCLDLPVEAWEEPKLLSECPSCHQPLKYNPFVVDNRDKY